MRIKQFIRFHVCSHYFRKFQSIFCCRFSCSALLQPKKECFHVHDSSYTFFMFDSYRCWFTPHTHTQEPKNTKKIARIFLLRLSFALCHYNRICLSSAGLFTLSATLNIIMCALHVLSVSLRYSSLIHRLLLIHNVQTADILIYWVYFDISRTKYSKKRMKSHKR